MYIDIRNKFIPRAPKNHLVRWPVSSRKANKFILRNGFSRTMRPTKEQM